MIKTQPFKPAKTTPEATPLRLRLAGDLYSADKSASDAGAPGVFLSAPPNQDFKLGNQSFPAVRLGGLELTGDLSLGGRYELELEVEIRYDAQKRPYLQAVSFQPAAEPATP